MKNALPRPIYFALMLLALCATGAFADSQLSFNSVNAGYVMGGVYTSPYSILVDGTPTLLICDESGNILRSDSFMSDAPHAEHLVALAGLSHGGYLVIARSHNEETFQHLSFNP